MKGSPGAHIFWVKDRKVISYNEIEFCFEKSKGKLNQNERTKFDDLERKYKKLGYLIMKNKYPDEYKEYDKLRNLIPSNTACYYNLGYRFTAPIYWCMALDSPTNAKYCRENEKYRK